MSSTILKYQYAKLIRLPYPKPAALREGRIDLAYTVAASQTGLDLMTRFNYLV